MPNNSLSFLPLHVTYHLVNQAYSRKQWLIQIVIKIVYTLEDLDYDDNNEY